MSLHWSTCISRHTSRRMSVHRTDCPRCEHNMWFVDGELLAKAGQKIATHDDMAEHFWRMHFEETLQCIHVVNPCILSTLNNSVHVKAAYSANTADVQRFPIRASDPPVRRSLRPFGGCPLICTLVETHAYVDV